MYKKIIKYRFNLFLFILILMSTISLKNLYIKNDINFYQESQQTIVNSSQYKIDKNFIPTFENVLQLKTIGEIEHYLYTIDDEAYVTLNDLDLNKLINISLSTNLTGDDPKVLIFHTHSQEDYINSRDGNPEDSIVGVGDELARILTEKYGISVIHDVQQYDIVDGEVNREKSYEIMEESVQKILEEYSSIEIVIDLHRDGVSDDIHLVTEINGESTAQIMFFNGITKINEDGKAVDIPELFNPYIEENLALSLQMQLTANEIYPLFTRKIYIKPYRYGMHMRPKSMLVEVGANTNTVQEAKNAMDPLAEIIVLVLGKK